MNRYFVSVRAWALACGLGLCVPAPDACALFIVNQPWLRPAKSGQSTEMYMNLTSTDGARQDIPLLAEARLRSPVDDELRSRHKHAH